MPGIGDGWLSHQTARHRQVDPDPQIRFACLRCEFPDCDKPLSRISEATWLPPPPVPDRLPSSRKGLPNRTGLGTPVIASESGIFGVVNVRSFPAVAVAPKAINR